jgi:hypothetical protein
MLQCTVGFEHLQQVPQDDFFWVPTIEITIGQLVRSHHHNLLPLWLNRALNVDN